MITAVAAVNAAGSECRGNIRKFINPDQTLKLKQPRDREGHKHCLVE